MKILSPEHKVSEGLVATIGFFDGVHLGHQYLIEQLNSIAKEHALPSGVITFPIHPRKVLDTDYKPALLCGYDERVERLSTTDVDYCCPINFTLELSKYSAKEFMAQVLKKCLNVKVLLIGYDHHFGHNRDESFEDYVRHGEELGIEVIKAEEYESADSVSSSSIRRALSEGDIAKANAQLSYNYNITGKIVEGFKVGRTIGFPTANIEVWERYKVIPALGVYAVCTHVGKDKYGGMLYIGTRPTLHNGENISIEVNLFDFDGDLYGQTLTVEFLEFVRHDEKFDGIENLKNQIAKDKYTVKEKLEKYLD